MKTGRSIPDRYKRKRRGRPSRTPKFRSNFEVSVAQDLTARKVRFEYETLVVPYTLFCTYNPDFVLPNNIIVETKGVLDEETKRKMLAAKLQNDQLDIRFLFMSKASKKNKVLWERWCNKNNYKFAYDVVPESWVSE